MHRGKTNIILCLSLIWSFLLIQEGKAAQRQFVTIGTGGVTGLYYPTGGAICRMVNRGKKIHGIRCNVEATGGSEFNINSIASKELDLGVAQSDVVYNAWHGEAPFLKKRSQMRSVFSIHPETLTLVTRKETKIRRIKDLKGKRVNIGNPGSGQRRTSLELFASCGIKEEELALAGDLKAAEMPDALRDKKIDAYFYTIGHPNANIQDIATTLDVMVVPITGKCVENLITQRPYYVKSAVPGGLYRGVDKDVPTFGVKATLMTSESVPNDVIYHLVKAVFENLEEFRNLHPAYRRLDQKGMLKGLSPPFHPGAEKYYKEKGLL